MPPESRVPPVQVGEVLAGKYRVERVIGEGGMGVVVAAKHLQLDSLVALKFITQNRGKAAERFLREARSAVRLKSEHVARVSDVGTLENDMPFMVMEYLEGQDLNSVVASSGPLPIGDAVGYMVHACEAIAEAHALGIVHRDLKPHNLFLTVGIGGRPKVKVLDFGVSKATGADLALTNSMEIVGTPTYMAPEQLKSSKDVDLRADIWAIGVVLYELLTARLPFEAESLPQLCTMVLSENPVPPSVLRAEIPAQLNEAILRCLQRSPDDRFVDVAELVTAIAPFAPEWAPVRGVLELPRSSTRGAHRAVITSPSGAASKTDAAWSETELANTELARTPTRRKIVRVAIPLAVAVSLLFAFNAGKQYVLHSQLQPIAPGRAAETTAAIPPANVVPTNGAQVAAYPTLSDSAKGVAGPDSGASVPLASTTAIASPTGVAAPQPRAKPMRSKTQGLAAPSSAASPEDDPYYGVRK
jgi:eukaryotic-like serine/threonine-protein kinase